MSDKPQTSPYTRPIIGESFWTMMLEMTGHKKEAAKRAALVRKWRSY